MYLAVITLLALVACSQAAPKQEIDCENSRGKIDSCGRELFMFGDRNQVFPENKDDLKSEHCPKVKHAESCIREYAKTCLKPFPKQVIGLLIYGSSKQTKRRCSDKDPAGQEEFLRHTPCANRELEPSHKCMDQYILELESIRENVDDKDLKLPYTCCYYYKFKKCVVTEMERTCGVADSVEYLKTVVDGTTDDARDLTCGKYVENSRECANLPPLNVISDPSYQRGKSVIPALVDIYTDL